jgi:hypothetical protein
MSHGASGFGERIGAHRRASGAGVDGMMRERARDANPTLPDKCNAIIGLRWYVRELSGAFGYEPWFTTRLLRILQRIGRIQRHPLPVRITLTSPALVSSQVSAQIGPAVHLVPERKAFKACIECASPAVTGRTRCERHLQASLAAVRRSRERSKLSA